MALADVKRTIAQNVANALAQRVNFAAFNGADLSQSAVNHFIDRYIADVLNDVIDKTSAQNALKRPIFTWDGVAGPDKDFRSLIHYVQQRGTNIWTIAPKFALALFAIPQMMPTYHPAFGYVLTQEQAFAIEDACAWLEQSGQSGSDFSAGTHPPVINAFTFSYYSKLTAVKQYAAQNFPNGVQFCEPGAFCAYVLPTGDASAAPWINYNGGDNAGVIDYTLSNQPIVNAINAMGLPYVQIQKVPGTDDGVWNGFLYQFINTAYSNQPVNYSFGVFDWSQLPNELLAPYLRAGQVLHQQAKAQSMSELFTALSFALAVIGLPSIVASIVADGLTFSSAVALGLDVEKIPGVSFGSTIDTALKYASAGNFVDSAASSLTNAITSAQTVSPTLPSIAPAPTVDTPDMLPDINAASIDASGFDVAPDLSSVPDVSTVDIGAIDFTSVDLNAAASIDQNSNFWDEIDRGNVNIPEDQLANVGVDSATNLPSAEIDSTKVNLQPADEITDAEIDDALMGGDDVVNKIASETNSSASIIKSVFGDLTSLGKVWLTTNLTRQQIAAQIELKKKRPIANYTPVNPAQYPRNTLPPPGGQKRLTDGSIAQTDKTGLVTVTHPDGSVSFARYPGTQGTGETGSQLNKTFVIGGLALAALMLLKG